MKKYKIRKDGHIVALRDIPSVVCKGDVGGTIDNEDNLSHDGNCWVFPGASVRESAFVGGNAQVSGNAIIRGLARVVDKAEVNGDAVISGDAFIGGYARVAEHAKISGNARVKDHAYIMDNAVVTDASHVYDNAVVSDNAVIAGEAHVTDHMCVRLDTKLTKKRDAVYVGNLRYPLTITPKYVFGGCRDFTHKQFQCLTRKQCGNPNWTQKELRQYKAFLKAYQAGK